jgi:hypothetical protein
MSQSSKILELLKDGQKHHVGEILDFAYGSDRFSAANLTGRISELRRKGYKIECTPDEKFHSQSWYRLLGKEDSPQMSDWKRTKIAPRIVHHLDLNTRNNDIANLHLCQDRREHNRLHYSLELTAAKLFRRGVIKFKDSQYTDN